MGFRVVLFDGPSHGASDPGAFGPTSTTGVELAKALDAVFTRFGPGEAIVAHSMGAVASLLALDRGWIGVRRLVFLAPMTSYAATMDGLATRLGFGPRVRRRIDALVWRRVGVAPEDFELGNLWARLERPLPTLVVHDTTDRQTSYADARLVAGQIGAELMTTSGLGHNRLLRDQDVIARVARFLRAEVATPLSA